jgi:hypothetical protein
MQLKENIKVKHCVGIHHITDEFPTLEDVEFDIVFFLYKKGRVKGKNKYKLSKKDLNTLFKNQLTNETLKQALKSHLRYLIDNQYLVFDSEIQKYNVSSECVEKFLE